MLKYETHGKEIVLKGVIAGNSLQQHLIQFKKVVGKLVDATGVWVTEVRQVAFLKSNMFLGSFEILLSSCLFLVWFPFYILKWFASILAKNFLREICIRIAYVWSEVVILLNLNSLDNIWQLKDRIVLWDFAHFGMLVGGFFFVAGVKKNDAGESCISAKWQNLSGSIRTWLEIMSDFKENE